ncbi:hypothetical protein BKA62DRAFT_773795 [Auriculariales sp. MPI-PUGE-AT-0066]|nr:hypothetical protein BKA62DRAFT_773795 [Auriculariales sp. MPI-PUGE-AT-0066]
MDPRDIPEEIAGPVPERVASPPFPFHLATNGPPSPGSSVSTQRLGMEWSPQYQAYMPRPFASDLASVNPHVRIVEQRLANTTPFAAHHRPGYEISRPTSVSPTARYIIPPYQRSTDDVTLPAIYQHPATHARSRTHSHSHPHPSARDAVSPQAIDPLAQSPAPNPPPTPPHAAAVAVAVTDGDLNLACAEPRCTFRATVWTSLQQHAFATSHRSFSCPFPDCPLTARGETFVDIQARVIHAREAHGRNETLCEKPTRHRVCASPACAFYVAPSRHELDMHFERVHMPLMTTPNPPNGASYAFRCWHAECRANLVTFRSSNTCETHYRKKHKSLKDGAA